MTTTLAVLSAPAQSLGETTLVLAPEQAYITETATGLAFAPNTPLEMLGGLLTRMTRYHKRLEWCIGDAINFGETNYPGMYEQWVEQTGLAENTLATMAWVSRAIPPLRRREDVGWSHHREVAGIDDPRVQDRLLSEAADKGMTRWEIRQRVKSEQEAIRGKGVTATGEVIPEPDLAWCPTVDELTAEARAALESGAPSGRQYRVGYERGFVQALIWADCRDAFVTWRGPE